MANKCPNCDAPTVNGANYCHNCGEALTPEAAPSPYRDFHDDTGRKNGLGLAGFIISIVAAATSWIYIYGWIVWLVGIVLSIIAVFWRPRGFAYWGVIISIIGFFITFGVYSANLGAGMFYWY